jgi:pimeloyl-ACP methyl ester carboxylesterase
VVDDAERTLDEHNLERPHITGNSLGGWVALELARRGRARSVCALSPAGFWTAGTADQTDSVRKLRRTILSARLGRLLPMSVLLRAPVVRRLVLRDVAEHGDQLSAPQVIEAVKDLLGCAIADDIFGSDEEIAPLDPSPWPITLAWSSQDRILPPGVNGAVARARVPEATFLLLTGCGHVPMIDDPAAVAETILRSVTTRRTEQPARRMVAGARFVEKRGLP